MHVTFGVCGIRPAERGWCRDDHRETVWYDRLFSRVVGRQEVFHQAGDGVGNSVWHVDACIAEADTSKSRSKRHVRPRLHIHAIKYSTAQVTPGVLQCLLAPHVTDEIATDVDWTLFRFMPWTGIVRTTCVGFERVGEHVEARIC